MHKHTLAGLVTLTIVVLLGLPWTQWVFAGLSVGLAALFSFLARRAGSTALRWILGGLAGLWVLSAVANAYSAPGYNIRPDLVLSQVFGLPVTVVVEALVLFALWTAARAR